MSLERSNKRDDEDKMKKTGWAFIGASTIADQWMIDAVREAGGEVLSLHSRDAKRGAEFAARRGIAALAQLL